MAQEGLPPGYRFSPTDEELVALYLKNRAYGKCFHPGVIAEVDIYKYEPWELPEKSVQRSLDPVWYFFNAQDRRHSHTARINRTTSKGYWKATGKDRKIYNGPHIVGIKKTLIYYEGRAPSGKRTDWIMHEYKLDEETERRSTVQNSIALCRIRKKGGPGPRNGEQYGASVVHDNTDWGEDAKENVDEKLPLLPDREFEVSAPIIPSQITTLSSQGGVVSHDFQTEGCASNDLSLIEADDILNPELDMQAFLDLVLNNDTEATSGLVSPYFGLGEPFAGHQSLDLETNATLYSLSDIQSLPEDDKVVEDILHPSSSEKQMLEEMLHDVDGGPLHASNAESSGRPMPRSPAYSDDALAFINAFLFDDNVGPSRVEGDFIELNDMNSPLDGFVIRSPLHGGFYTAQDDQDQLFARLNGSEHAAGSSDLLHTQGLAARRARLQVAPSGAKGRRAQIHEQVNTYPKVQYGEVSRDKYIEYVGGNFGQSTNVASSDSEGIFSVGKSLPRIFLSKHMSHCLVTKCEEVPPQVFISTSDEESGMHDSIRGVAVSSRPQNMSCVAEKSSPDCKVVLEPECLLTSEHLSKRSCMQDVGVDCEAGPSSIGVNRVESGHAGVASTLPHGVNTMGELVNKLKSLTLGRGLAQLDSSLNTAFNDKVFALGKQAAQQVSLTNPYRSLRRGAMASLFQLGIAVVLLFFLFLGIHVLNKYVLSAAART